MLLHSFRIHPWHMPLGCKTFEDARAVLWTHKLSGSCRTGMHGQSCFRERMDLLQMFVCGMAVGQNPVLLINIKTGGKWMFIHPKMEPLVMPHGQIASIKQGGFSGDGVVSVSATRKRNTLYRTCEHPAGMLTATSSMAIFEQRISLKAKQPVFSFPMFDFVPFPPLGFCR